MAMYRAAERAREQGYAYVQLLGGSARDGAGFSFADIHVRPSHSPEAPAGCRSRRAGTCYTADAAEVMRRLSGDSGAEPGVPVTDHYDRYGQAVSYSGFGVGAVPATPVAASSPARPAVEQLVVVPQGPSQQERLDAALQATRPVQGREPRQGWTVSE